jgi:hypothetical protein
MKLSPGALLRCPRCWLAVQVAAVILVAGSAGLWRLQLASDSASYMAASGAPLAEAMVGIRTLGYPLLLRGVAAFSPDYRLLPWVHLAMLAAAVFLFDFSLRRFGVSPWASLAASSALLYAALPRHTPVACLLADFPAMMLAVMTVACLLWVVAERSRILPWLGLTFCLAAAYHVRPAYLFLIPLAPCLGVVFAFLWSKRGGKPLFWKGLAVGLSAVAVLPLLAYSSLRLRMVGDFGLVSFIGYNLSALAAELLEAPMIEGELSEHCRPLANAILAQRQRLHMTPAFGPGPRISLAQYEENLSVNIWGVAVPAAHKIFGSDPVVCNRELSRLSREVIGLRKGRCLLWVAASFPRAAAKILWFQWIVPLLLPVAAASLAVRLWLGRQARQRSAVAGARSASASPPPGERGPTAGFPPGDISLLAALTALYFLAGVAMLCLAGTSLDSRLVVPTGMFLPSLLALWIAHEWEKIRLLRRA